MAAPLLRSRPTNFEDILFTSCALYLDFDGTLVDIAHRPEAVVVPPALIHTLEALNLYLGGGLALISGRPIAQIDEFLHPLELPAAGVHGAERRSSSGEITRLAAPPLDVVERVAQALADAHPKLRVETKRGSVALHYRQAPQLEAQCFEAMRLAVEQSPGLTLLRGKMVVEA